MELSVFQLCLQPSEAQTQLLALSCLQRHCSISYQDAGEGFSTRAVLRHGTKDNDGLTVLVVAESRPSANSGEGNPIDEVLLSQRDVSANVAREKARVRAFYQEWETKPPHLDTGPDR